MDNTDITIITESELGPIIYNAWKWYQEDQEKLSPYAGELLSARRFGADDGRIEELRTRYLEEARKYGLSKKCFQLMKSLLAPDAILKVPESPIYEDVSPRDLVMAFRQEVEWRNMFFCRIRRDKARRWKEYLCYKVGGYVFAEELHDSSPFGKLPRYPVAHVERYTQAGILGIDEEERDDVIALARKINRGECRYKPQPEKFEDVYPEELRKDLGEPYGIYHRFLELGSFDCRTTRKVAIFEVFSRLVRISRIEYPEPDGDIEKVEIYRRDKEQFDKHADGVNDIAWRKKCFDMTIESMVRRRSNFNEFDAISQELREDRYVNGTEHTLDDIAAYIAKTRPGYIADIARMRVACEKALTDYIDGDGR